MTGHFSTGEHRLSLAFQLARLLLFWAVILRAEVMGAHRP